MLQCTSALGVYATYATCEPNAEDFGEFYALPGKNYTYSVMKPDADVKTLWIEIQVDDKTCVGKLSTKSTYTRDGSSSLHMSDFIAKEDIEKNYLGFNYGIEALIQHILHTYPQVGKSISYQNTRDETDGNRKVKSHIWSPTKMHPALLHTNLDVNRTKGPVMLMPLTIQSKPLKGAE